MVAMQLAVATYTSSTLLLSPLKGHSVNNNPVCKWCSNINHALFACAGCSDYQKPIGNALTTLFFNHTHPKSSKGHFFGKIQHCWKLVLSPLQMGQNYYLARSTGHKCWIWKINENAWCIFEDKGMFPKVHWRILEDSGSFLARIPRGLWLN